MKRETLQTHGIMACKQSLKNYINFTGTELPVPKTTKYRRLQNEQLKTEH